MLETLDVEIVPVLRKFMGLILYVLLDLLFYDLHFILIPQYIFFHPQTLFVIRLHCLLEKELLMQLLVIPVTNLCTIDVSLPIEEE